MANLQLFLSHNDSENKPKDLSNNGNWPFAILPSIAGIRYVIGSNYLLRNDKEFIFYQSKSTAGTQCYIYVDKKDKFWISPGLRSSKTFVNLELLKRPLALNENDNISFGLPRNFDDSKDCPVFLVKLEQFPPVEHQVCITDDNQNYPVFLGNNPSTIDLLPSIFKYLNIRDLKSCSLVSRMWNDEARKVLEQRGNVIIPFSLPYYDPKNSMRIFNYLHRPNPLKIRHLTLSIPQLGDLKSSTKQHRNVCQKVLHDFEKFLSSNHNFTKLTLTSSINNTKEYSAFLKILKALGKNLLELNFKFSLNCDPEVLASPVILPVQNLKRFFDIGWCFMADKRGLDVWFASLHSNFRGTLVDLSTDLGPSSIIKLQEIVKSSPSKLKHLEIRSTLWDFLSEFQDLLKLDAKLETLILSVGVCKQKQADQISDFLERNATSLKILQIDLRVHGSYKKPIQFSLPAFPSLSELNFSYSKDVRVKWEDGELDYKKHFPILRILEIHENNDTSIPKLKGNDLFEREKPGSVFSSFVPIETEIVCKTVNKLTIALHEKITVEEYRRYNLRLFRIPEMFPEVKVTTAPNLGLTERKMYYPRK